MSIGFKSSGRFASDRRQTEMTMLKHAKSSDWGLLLLRLSIGGLMLFHGVDKLLGGVEGVAELLTSRGLPGFLSWGVLVGEVAAPLMIVAGFYARPAGAVLAFNMLVAILLAHPADVFKIGAYGEWAIELQMLYLLGGLSIMLLDAGLISVSRANGRVPIDDEGGADT
jgi:putative oxidoreductase